MLLHARFCSFFRTHTGEQNYIPTFFGLLAQLRVCGLSCKSTQMLETDIKRDYSVYQHRFVYANYQ